MQGKCSVHYILLSICYCSVRDAIPSGGSSTRSLRIAAPTVSRSSAVCAFELIQKATFTGWPYSMILPYVNTERVAQEVEISFNYVSLLILYYV